MFGIELSGGDATAKAIEIIKAGGRASKREQIKEIIAGARRYKPAGYDAHGAKARRMYLGDQVGYVRAALAERYPSTHQKMTPVALNIVRTVGELDAQAYRDEPERWCLDEDGEVNQEATEELLEAVKGARLNVSLPEMERRAGIGAGSVFARLMPRVVEHGPGRSERKRACDLFWPDEIHVIPDPDAPEDLWASYALAARIASDGPRKWEVWFRASKADFWHFEIVDEEGNSEGVTDSGLAILPWVHFVDQLTQGTVWSVGNRDLVAFQDAVNVALSNWWFKDDMQGHKQVVISGPQPQKGRTLIGGPGAVWDLPEGTTVESLDADHDMTTLDGLEKSLKMLGQSLRQSSDAWATEPGPPLSGISRIVQNIAPNQKRDERTTLFKEAEETRLLPLLAEISDRYFGTSITASTASYRVRFAPPPDFEEPRAKLDRALMARDAGLISDALAAVKGGVYRTIEEAVAAGLSPDLKQPEPEPEMVEDQGEPAPVDVTQDEDEG